MAQSDKKERLETSSANLVSNSWIGVHGYSRLAAVGLKCGFNLEKTLKESNIDFELQNRTGHFLQLKDVLTLFDLATRGSSKSYFPLELPKHFGFDAMPEIEAFLSTSPDLKIASRVLEWLPVLLVKNFEFHVQQQSNRTVLLFSCGAEVDQPGSKEITETVISCAELFLIKLLPDVGDLQASFCHSPITDLKNYDAAFLKRPLFDQPFNGLSMPFSGLDKPIANNGSQINALAALAIENSMAELLPQGTAREQVARAIRRAPAISLHELASKMNTPPRTLQRRLKEEGTTFQQVQDEELKTIACNHLRTPDLDIESISSKLGFSDRHSFSRAFKRWTGSSPKAWRAR